MAATTSPAVAKRHSTGAGPAMTSSDSQGYAAASRHIARAALASEHAPNGVALVGLDGSIEYANHALAQTTGFSQQALRHMKIGQLIRPRQSGSSWLDADDLDGLISGALTRVESPRLCVGADGDSFATVQLVSVVRSEAGEVTSFVVEFHGTNESATHIEALETEIARLHRSQAIGRIGSWEFDIASDAFDVSDGAIALFGFTRENFPGVREALDQCVLPADRDIVREANDAVLTTGLPQEIRYRIRRITDGTVRWIHSRGVLINDNPDALGRVVGTLADVTELAQAEADAQLANAELINAHAHQQAVITATPDAIHIYDVPTRTLTRANLLAPDFIGYTKETIAVMSGQSLDELVPADELRQLEQVLLDAQALPDGQVRQLRHRVIPPEGDVRWLSRRLTPFHRDEHGVINQILVVTRDVTEVVEVEQRLSYAALHDELTGLPNRRMAREHLASLLCRPVGPGQPPRGRVVAMLCDLDSFKRINDSHGHRTGDSLLVATAERLTAATRPGDLVARLGGDEFVVVLDVSGPQDAYALADTVAKRIEQTVCDPIIVGSEEHLVTVSIGICVAEHGQTAEAVLSDADTAMYYVKSHGANGHRIFDPSLRRDTVSQDHIERQIRRALAEDSLEVFYQPIVNPATNAIYGVEALLRISEDDGGFLDTEKVIAVAEQTGLISRLDARTLEIACQQVAAWRQEPEFADLKLTLNRSARDIAKPGFYDRVSEILTRSGLGSQALTLEITETVLLDADRTTLADIRELSRQGVGIAIDDFGTGYASLSYLTALPITCIKIDRSFTSGLPDDLTCKTLVRATVGIAEDLGINCVVEGVETATQLAALPHYDRLLIQGYFFGRPRPASAGLRR